MSKIDGIIKKLVSVEKEISNDKGKFVLFALVQRIDILKEKEQEKWDLVISAPWLTNTHQNREYIFGELLKAFKGKGEEIADFMESLVPINSKDEFIDLITQKVGELEHEETKAHFGKIVVGKKLNLANVYVITSKRITKNVSRRTIQKSVK